MKWFVNRIWRHQERVCQNSNHLKKINYLRAVELSEVKFIQFKTDLIAARVFYYSYSIKKRATMDKSIFYQNHH